VVVIDACPKLSWICSKPDFPLCASFANVRRRLKQKLLGISKRGNRYLRKLFVQCARAVLQQKTKQSPGLKQWLEKLTARTPYNVASVALASKLARMAWAVLATGEAYRTPFVAAA
jgi:transposase